MDHDFLLWQSKAKLPAAYHCFTEYDAVYFIRTYIAIFTHFASRSNQIGMKAHASISAIGFPQDILQAVAKLTENEKHRLRCLIEKVLLNRDAYGRIHTTVPVEVLLAVLQTAKAHTWLPVAILATRVRGVDLAELVETYPQLFLRQDITDSYTPYDICLGLANINTHPQLKDCLLHEVETTRSRLSRLYREQN